jgi:uncharacterized integral membrane protein
MKEVASMLSVLLTLFFGFGFGYFAVENTAPVTIRFGKFFMPHVPLYWVALGSIITGLIITGSFYFARKVSDSLFDYARETARIRTKTTQADLEQKIRELETVNARLRSAQNPDANAPSRALLSRD